MRPVKVKQRDLTDCGAACLASIASHYGLQVPIATVRQYASTDKKGTNVLGLIEAGKKMGFDVRGVRGQTDSLTKIPKPAIAHVIIDKKLQHYVVIYHVTNQNVEVMDPGLGEMTRWSHEEFKKMWSGVLVLFLPNQDFKPLHLKTSIWSRFWLLIRPQTSLMVQTLVGALIYTLIGLSTSIYVQKIIDHVLVEQNKNLLNLMSILMIILLLIQVIINIMKNIITLQIGQLIDARLILGYYKHLLKLPQAFFDTMRVGEMVSRINDAVKIRSFINEGLTNIVVSIFILVFSLALMFTFYWKLALIILLIVPFYTIIYVVTNKLNKKAERKIMENTAELESQLVESINSITTIKSFSLESEANIKTENQFLSLLKKVYNSTLNSIFTSTSSEFISRLFIIILLWSGAGFALSGEITPGELFSFYTLIGYFTGPVTSLLGSNKTIQNALIAADRLFEITEIKLESEENKMTITPKMIGNIRFVEVNFRYGTRSTIYERLNLEIPKGQTCAIVGESGAGKSTLLAILQGLYHIQSGHIYIGEFDLQYLSQESLRKIISTVPQKIDLFAGNVIDNIAPGDSTPDINKIITICGTLGILDFIEKLPQGLNTYIGENGASLSGGQKQRLALARALYKEPEILILDEATASLDSAAEKFVQRMIALLRAQNKTIIIIAHRLSTIYKADKIIVLHQGKVAEEGTHEELMQTGKVYHTMWKNQFPMMTEI